jgi:hypothetical protein
MGAIKSLYNKILLNDIDKETAEIIIGKGVKIGQTQRSRRQSKKSYDYRSTQKGQKL